MGDEDNHSLSKHGSGLDKTRSEYEQELRVSKSMGAFRPIRFKGAILAQQDGIYVTLTETMVAQYLLLNMGSGLPKTKIKDTHYALMAIAPDRTEELQHLIAFGGKVWDMETLDWRNDISPEDCVYRTDYQPDERYKALSYAFVKELANGSPDVARDILVSIAPLLMATRPTGVIWWLGDGANGKSSLTTLVYKVFGSNLSGFDVKQLEDGKVAPMLNGKLGNVVRESFSGYIENTDVYKSLGTHESLMVRRLGTNESIEISGDLHHIFSTNSIPTFGDKSNGIARRTWTIPFDNKFPSDPTFEERTFTKEFINGFVYMITEATRTVRDEGYNYERLFSERTRGVRDDYQLEANSADAYFNEMIESGLVGFTNYGQLHQDYQQWCLEHGHNSYNLRQFSRVSKNFGFERSTYINNEAENTSSISAWYRISNDIKKEDTERFSLARLGPLRKVRHTTSEQAAALSEPEQQSLPVEVEEVKPMKDLPNGF